MRKSVVIAIICVLFTMIDYCSANQSEKPDIERIVIEKETSSTFSGTGKVKFYAMVITSNNTIVRNSQYSEVNWYMKKMNNTIFYPKINQTAHLVKDKNSKYYGCSCAIISAPFGTKENFYKVFAENKLEPLFDQESEIFFKTDPDNRTFFNIEKGKVEIGRITGKAPKIEEKYNSNRDEYTITFPKSTYKSKYYDFAGWRISNKLYKPGQKYSNKAESNDRKIVAYWKAKFNTPNIYVKRNKKSNDVCWDVIAGANKGYKLYRKNGKKGKYKLLKTYWHKRWNFYRDDNVKKGKTYWYKIKAIKKKNGRTICRTSNWAKVNMKVNNERYVKLSRRSITGKPGQRMRIKGKVKRYGRTKMFKEDLRWYSSDKSIAIIGRKSGKLKLIKKGKCFIHALTNEGYKSHNTTVCVK